MIHHQSPERVPVAVSGMFKTFNIIKKSMRILVCKQTTAVTNHDQIQRASVVREEFVPRFPVENFAPNLMSSLHYKDQLCFIKFFFLAVKLASLILALVSIIKILCNIFYTNTKVRFRLDFHFNRGFKATPLPPIAEQVRDRRTKSVCRRPLRPIIVDFEIAVYGNNRPSGSCSNFNFSMETRKMFSIS